MIHVQTPLLASCVLPSCTNVVDEAGDACGDCQLLWGPFLGRHGDLPAWHPRYVPSCHHGFTWWRGTKCDLCGCADTEPINASHWREGTRPARGIEDVELP